MILHTVNFVTVLFQHQSAKTILVFKPDGHSVSWFPGVWNVLLQAACAQPWHLWLQAWELSTKMQDHALDLMMRCSYVKREGPSSSHSCQTAALQEAFLVNCSERERRCYCAHDGWGGPLAHACHLPRWATWSLADKRMFLIAALLGKGVYHVHMECGHLFSVRDDHGIRGNLLQWAEPLGREATQLVLFRCFSLELTVQALPCNTVCWMASLFRGPSPPAVSAALSFPDPRPQVPQQASVSSARRRNLFTNLGVEKGFQSLTHNLKAIKRKINLIALKLFYKEKSKNSIERQMRNWEEKYYRNSKSKGLASCPNIVSKSPYK